MSLPKEKNCTYADYLEWDGDVRYELIDGVPYAMSPAPSQIHQEISMALSNQLYNFLKGKSCQVFTAPFDVRLNADTGDNVVVQPDLLVVCDKSKLDGKSCVGAPDAVIEILSPSTARMDRFTKLKKYQYAGVKEYWIVDPDTKTVQVCILENGKYVITMYENTDVVPVYVLEGCTLNMLEVFPEEWCP